MNGLPRFLGAVVLAAGMGLWAEATRAADAPAAPSAIKQIQEAPDPSAVVDAYVRAAAATPDNVEVQRAYVQRMVQLGAPDLAYSQAMSLTVSDAGNGLAWAVVADTKGLRGDAETALADIAKAQALAPSDPFVLRISGQLLAWYDVHLDKSKLSQGTKDTAEALHRSVGGQKAFADAYEQTKGAYTRSDQAQAPAAPAPVATPAPAAAAPPVVYYDAPTYSYSYESAPPPEYYYSYPPEYVAPAYGPYYYGYGYGYPSYWWGGLSLGFEFGDHHGGHFGGGHGGHHGHH